MPLKKILSASLVAVSLSAAPAWSDSDAIPAKKQTQTGLYLTAVEAAEILRDSRVVLVDVRSRAEVAFVGLPERADINIPLMELGAFPAYDMKKHTYTLEENPFFQYVFADFAADRGLTVDSPIILICRSGSRSARAADLISQLGFERVYSVIDGFEGDTAKTGPNQGQRVVNGWKNAGLEWTYAIRHDQLYPEDR